MLTGPTRRVATALLAGMVSAGSAGFAPAAGPYDVVPWGSKTLSIPYAWAGATAPAAGARVILYHSADRGRSWKAAGEATPQVRAFRFHAPSDGEHWFAVRTYDAYGRATPAGPLAPEMRVAVDTTPPQISPPTVEWSAGRVTLEVAASDATGLTGGSLHAYAQADDAGPWAPITLSTDTALETLTATGRWTPPQTARRITVRVTAEDAARNRASEEATAVAPQAAPLFAADARPDAPRHPLAGRSAALDPFAAAEQRTPTPIPSASGPTRGAAVATRAWPFDRAGARSFERSPPPASPFGTASFHPLE
ncbi:MAG: hypothetical protein AAF805_08505, partial [Planctomycetota bacterium]